MANYPLNVALVDEAQDFRENLRLVWRNREGCKWSQRQGMVDLR